MRISQILELLLLTSFLSGCWLAHVKDEAPGSLGNIDLLQSLIGQRSESVVRELGLPNELLSDGDKLFMVYSARASDTEFLMIIWIPVWAMKDPGNTLHCLRFELDSDDEVKEYRLKSRVMQTLVLVVEVELASNCREVFWSKKELLGLQVIEDFSPTWKEVARMRMTGKAGPLVREAEQGDTNAQLALFKQVLSQDTNRAIGWLCKSADLGNQEARSILAKIYEYGGYVWVKNSVVRQNYKLAYVWHGLSGLYSQEDLQYFADRYLTAAELSEAKNMLRDWRPGQCERDLGLVSFTE